MYHFHFDSCCFKRDFSASSIFQPLCFIHLCVGIEHQFYDNIHFFLLFRTICLCIYEKTLTENAIPTIFSYTKPTRKRKTVERRQSCSTKRRLIDNATQTNVEIELIDKENLLLVNPKLCQTGIAISSVYKQMQVK